MFNRPPSAFLTHLFQSAAWLMALLIQFASALPEARATAAFQITQQPPGHGHTFAAPVYMTTVEFSTPDPGSTTVQWQKDGVDVPGATSATLTITNPTFADGGYYRALVTYNGQTLTSSSVRLAVDSTQIRRLFGPPNSSSIPYLDSFASFSIIDPFNPSTTAAVAPVDEAASHEPSAVRLRTPLKRFGAFASITVNPVNLAATAQKAAAVALGDFNGDTFPDLVVGDHTAQNSAQTILVYLNNRPNNPTADPFASVTPITLASGPSQAVAVADLNGDGWPDILVAHNGVNKAWFNTGAPATPFMGVTPTDIGADADNTQAVLLVDIDGDHDPDLITGNNGVNRLYLNNGSSMPFMGVAAMSLTADSADTRSLATGDIDADGDLDLVVGNSGAPDRIYLNNGTRNPFMGVVGMNLDAARSSDTRAVVVKDLNSDGWLDILVGHANADNLLYLNTKMPATPFAGVTPYAFTGDQPTVDLQSVDIDVDGDMDILVTRLPASGSGTHKVYLNNGRQDTPFGSTKPTLINPSGIHPTRIVLGDLDRDGDPDMVAGDNTSGPSFYDNAAGDQPLHWLLGLPHHRRHPGRHRCRGGRHQPGRPPRCSHWHQRQRRQNLFRRQRSHRHRRRPLIHLRNPCRFHHSPSFLLLQDVNGDLFPDLAVIRSGVLTLFMNNGVTTKTARFSSVARGGTSLRVRSWICIGNSFWHSL